MKKIFLGIKGHTLCLNRETGEIVWSTKLKSTSGVTNIYYEDGFVFAYAGGYMFCLNSNDGTIKWGNKLSGFGYDACIIASENQSSAAIASQIASQQASAALVTTTVIAPGGSGNS